MQPMPKPLTETPPLRPGERLSQAEFHRRYEAYPEDIKFELIGGVVHMASPLFRPHAKGQSQLSTIFGLYEGGTPGVEALDNITTILGKEVEVQPDLMLRILTEHGGQSRIDEKGRIIDAPELLAEVADSSEDIDLGGKREEYERAGVREYLVVCLVMQEVRWFDFRRETEIRPQGGIYRSRIFPGLWIDRQALLERRLQRMIEVVQLGIASPQHARFVERLARAHRRLSRQQP
jgi:hypothetical protein